ncbi:thiopeptide-type bacteriocin biosynthesis protein [Bacillus atrophaeus]|uniref:thiopeptide-type bacteriocin biosynthesis protein n=1 Tax=Bacillus atrophaeus TaxID=1452 RepID=UPI00227F7699|nr:thiopeptide-type bacteriocin biosynthesis protein [Bacillus atrophaeus]MCY9160072.1 thiopeptide-type bacteriocin biosynthesis protein [Bacillus atrophaeus]
MIDKWSSLHVFFHDFSNIETVLHRLIWPSLQSNIINAEIKKYFFIRYWEGGPHLRIRYIIQEGTDPEEFTERLIGSWTDYLLKHPSAIELEKETFYQSHSLEGKSKNIIPSLPWFPNNSVQKVPYIPEIERYGGKVGIQIAEEYFCFSSEFVREILQNQHLNTNRMAVALDIMYIIFKSFCEDDLKMEEYEGFWSQYAKGWLDWESVEYVEKIRLKAEMQVKKLGEQLKVNLETMWNQFKLNGVYRGIKSNNLLGMMSTIAQLTKSVPLIDFNNTSERRIIGSYMHMHNNRLGVYPAQEAYLSLLLEGMYQYKPYYAM